MIHFSDFHFLLEVLKNLRIYSFISFFLKSILKLPEGKCGWEPRFLGCAVSTFRLPPSGRQLVCLHSPLSHGLLREGGEPCISLSLLPVGVESPHVCHGQGWETAGQPLRARRINKHFLAQGPPDMSG